MSKKWLIKWTTISFLLLNIFCIGVWGSGPLFYIVKQQYGRVITRYNGTREIRTDAGVYFKLWSSKPWKFWTWVWSTEEFSMRDEFIYLDNDPKPHEMQAFDQVKFYGAGAWMFRVVDLYKFGILMREKPLEMLTAQLNGIAKEKIQSNTVETNVTNMGYINSCVYESTSVKKLEDKYGVDISSFQMTHAAYPPELNEGTAAAKKIKIISEAVKDAAPNIASSKETLAKADEYRLKQLIAGSGVTTEEGRQKALDTLRDLTFFEMLKEKAVGDTIFAIPYGSAPNITLPSPSAKKKKPASEAETESEINWTINVPLGTN